MTQPKLVTYNLNHIKTNSFVIKEEMGFDSNEVKELVLKKPKLWLLGNTVLAVSFPLGNLKRKLHKLYKKN